MVLPTSKYTPFKEDDLFLALKDGRADGKIHITEEEVQKARNGDEDTLCSIGDKYYKVKYYSYALAWYIKAENHKSNETQFRIGYMYYSGLGVKKNSKQAMTWFLKAVSNGGNRNAYNCIAEMYLDGIHLRESIPASIEWYTKSANLGCPFALCQLGWIYENVQEVQNLQKAVNWYTKSFHSGRKDLSGHIKRLNEQGYYAQSEDKTGENTRENIRLSTAMSGSKQSNITRREISDKSTLSNYRPNDLLFSNQKQLDKYRLMRNKVKSLEEAAQQTKEEKILMRVRVDQMERSNIKRDKLFKNKFDFLRQQKTEMENEINYLKESLSQQISTPDNNPSIRDYYN